ncbi:MAG TPA: hypothetical protein V6C65_18500 [Allocoleopsis sp.]
MNSKTVLHEVINFLEEDGITTWIFGGWAEELLGMAEPRSHKDIDLLYSAKTFERIDSLLRKNDQLREVTEKHFNHKRAFLYKNVLTEVLLVQTENGRKYTNFWAKNKFYWPDNTLDNNGSYRIASQSALQKYRKNHADLMMKTPKD